MLKTVKLLDIFVETDSVFFQDYVINIESKKTTKNIYLKCIYSIIFVFTATFDHFNESLLNSISFLKNLTALNV